MNRVFVWFGAAAVAAATGLGPMTARASPGTIVTGTFAGTMNSGSDDSGVFGVAGADLTDQLVSGTFSYDIDQLTVSSDGTVTNASDEGVGAIAVTLSLGGVSFTFTDQTSGDIYVGSDGIDQFTLTSTTDSFTDAVIASETITLDFYDPTTSFLHGVGLDQTFIATPKFSDATFSVFNIDASGVMKSASGTFSIDRASAVGVPEPNTAVLLITGLLGVVGLAKLRRRTSMCQRFRQCSRQQA